MYTVTDPVPGIMGQDIKLIALQILKLTFFGQLTYLILKVLTLGPHFKICVSSRNEKKFMESFRLEKTFKMTMHKHWPRTSKSNTKPYPLVPQLHDF